MTLPRIARPSCRPRPGPLLRRALAFLDRVASTLVRKNAVYGDSVGSPLRIFSRAAADEQLRVRIDDKLSRVARGARGLGNGEDTLLDLVGYLALLAAVRSGRFSPAEGRRTARRASRVTRARRGTG